jgi:NAD(P)-dependent dehydrogenase (short-subunit alcohol dehydrogenase family)
MANTNDRAAIITGGSRGLGRNTTLNLARRSVDIVFTYHSNAVEAQSLVREVEAMGRKAAAFQLDTGNVKALDGFAKEVAKILRGWGWERFDYLVNNAGTSLHKPFEQTTEAEFDQIVNVHFKGVYFLTQKLCGCVVHPSGAAAANRFDQSAQPLPFRSQVPFIPHHKLLHRRRIPAHRFVVPERHRLHDPPNDPIEQQPRRNPVPDRQLYPPAAMLQRLRRIHLAP